MNNTLRGEIADSMIEHYASHYVGFNRKDVLATADQILTLIESKMPERDSFNFGGTSTQVNYLTQEDAVQHGFNQAIDSVKSILRGRDDN